MDSGKGITTLLEGTLMQTAVNKAAEQIISEFSMNKIADLVFLGIQKSGVPFAERLLEKIGRETGKTCSLGTIDITMYRDDIGIKKTLPVIHETNIPFELDGKNLILADDIIQSGRTIRAALDVITDYGRPALIRLAVLIDRGRREYPIMPDYTGKKLTHIKTDEKIKTSWRENDGKDRIYKIDT